MKQYIVKRGVSVTRVLFVTTQITALLWVSVSYAIAAYATVKYGEVFPVVELSQQAIETILGVNIIKGVQNIWEHNDGGLFGKSKEESDYEDPAQ